MILIWWMKMWKPSAVVAGIVLLIPSSIYLSLVGYIRLSTYIYIFIYKREREKKPRKPNMLYGGNNGNVFSLHVLSKPIGL
jgi:hypothetical protein